jgi:nitrate reductase delta subunit
MTMERTPLFDGLAALVDYPEGDLLPHVRACVADLAAPSPAAAAELETFAREIAGTSVEELQEHYTEAFDLHAACALDLGWHLFGDAHERGAFMAALREDLQRAGVPDNAELPDHLTNILALLGRDEPVRAAALADFVAPAVDEVRCALAGSGSPYAHVLAAVRALVADVRAGRRQEVGAP